ncbi:unnamed protein product [Linum trigynum]|uniref:Uncharacterized protein n=1 Tax=Linum trigynum TaxID=586398 RepID=A0AAV2E7U7_9ROSI
MSWQDLRTRSRSGSSLTSTSSPLSTHFVVVPTSASPPLPIYILNFATTGRRRRNPRWLADGGGGGLIATILLNLYFFSPLATG